MPFLPRPSHLFAALCAALLSLPALAAQAEIRLTDLADREVVLDAPSKRIILGEARHLAILGMIMDDPVAPVVGWRQDKPLNPPTLAAYRARFPAVDSIATVGAGNRALSVESIIALDPDVLVLSLMDRNDQGVERAREQIEEAGIPVVYVDFFAHPLENSVPSLRIYGQLLGVEDRAEDFISFYESHLNHVRDELADASITRPTVFFQVHAAPSDCCLTVAGGVFADFLNVAGARNIATEASHNLVNNKLSLEYVISSDPDFYVATGGQHMASRGGLVLGADVDQATAEASFRKLISAPGFASLRAVEEGHASGIAHSFNDSPIHIALIERLAKTFHPDAFADLDPDATMKEIETRFSPVPMTGTWWIDEAH